MGAATVPWATTRMLATQQLPTPEWTRRMLRWVTLSHAHTHTHTHAHTHAQLGLAITVGIRHIWRVFDDFPAKTTVYTLYIYGYGQPYAQRIPSCMPWSSSMVICSVAEPLCPLD